METFEDRIQKIEELIFRRGLASITNPYLLKEDYADAGIRAYRRQNHTHNVRTIHRSIAWLKYED